MTTLTPLQIPRDAPEHAARFLAHLDDGITRAAKQLLIYESAKSYRQHSEDLKRAGDSCEAERFRAIADMLSLDPRLYVAGLMVWRAEGETHGFLRQYIALLTEQAAQRTAATAVAA